ncbi:MAG TPA: hypothetical protein VNS19_18560 [Acidimicrobiales bacterium]|nr:hypothetical protein [Acidimicrobiales bacterium]
MSLGGKVRRVGAASVLVLLVGLGGWIFLESRPTETRFCTLALGIARVDGVVVALQDGGEPGPDGCEGDETLRDMRVLGMDCKVRTPGGRVVVELQPNRPEGTCGLPEPGDALPDPWPHR